MEASAAIGDTIRFVHGFQEFLCERPYAVVAIQSEKYILVEVDIRAVRVSKNVRSLLRKNFVELFLAGGIQVVPMQPLLRSAQRKIMFQPDDNVGGIFNEKLSEVAASRRATLAPLFERRAEILSSAKPADTCNKIAHHAGLHQTYARALFFRWAAYSFDDAALEPVLGRKTIAEESATPKKKPGPKVADPSITPVGWAYDPDWELRMLAGWKKFAVAPTTLRRIHARTLVSEFKCVVDLSRKPELIFHPEGKSFPNERQFSRFIKKKLGEDNYTAGLYGSQTVRNHKKSNPQTIQQYVTNLLQEVHWDAQELAERPGDLLDRSTPGKPIIRVVATCAACGGDVGIGYDYGSESRWAYLMALLSMCMPKSDFGDLFGIEILDEHWPAIGVMMRARGDRGPAIAQHVTEIVSCVLNAWQEWCASYDPKGKSLVEASHHKQPSPEGKPISRTVHRTAMEIIRDDLRKTEKRFRSADMSHRIESLEQAMRIGVGTPLTIWQDLRRRGLYVGQRFPLEKIIPHTVPRYEVSIRGDGVHLGAARYLSQELEDSCLLERAGAETITGYAYALHMATKHIWLEYNGGLMKLTAVPVRLYGKNDAHTMTLEESFLFAQMRNRSRRVAEQLNKALTIRNEIEADLDSKAVAAFQADIGAAKSTGKRETIKQHERILKRKQ